MAAEKILLLTRKEVAGHALCAEIVAAQIVAEVVQTDDFDDFCDTADETSFAVFIADDPDAEQRTKILEIGEARHTPVVFLCTATVEKSAAIVVLKPFRLSAVLSVLMSAVGRFRNGAGADIALGTAVFRPASKTITAGTTVIVLTDKETALLSRLVQANHPLTKDDLLRDVWGAADGIESHTPETHVCALRQKLMAAHIEITSEKDGYALKY